MALGRALLIACLATWLARPVAALLCAHHRRWQHRLAWVFALAPLLIPAMLVGYVYINFATPLIRYPLLHELLYLVLVLMKLTPIAILVVCFAPAPAMTDAAVHCKRLLNGGWGMGWRQRLDLLTYWMRGRGRPLMAGFAAVFLLAFGEFELASLMEVRLGLRQVIGTWTVKLYDLQVGGTLLGETLKSVLVPLAIELIVIGMILVLLLRQRRFSSQGYSASLPPQTKRAQRMAWCYLTLAMLVTVCVPVAVVLLWSLPGWRGLINEPVVLKVIPNSVAFGIAGAAGAYLLGRASIALGAYGASRRRIARWLGAVPIVACVPGLLGSLVLGLIVLTLFQMPPLHWFYDTAIPLVVGLAVLLLPLAVVLILVLGSPSASSDHAIELLGQGPAKPFQAAARRLLWETRKRRRFWIVFVLFYFAYLDLSASTLLAPTALPTVMVQLYNLMHHGRYEQLSAQLVVTIAVPVLILLLASSCTIKRD
jgi:ABC-type Fe3+ transport system permease subunit